MRIYLTDQRDNFNSLIEDLMARPTMMFEKSKLKEKTSTIHIKSDRDLEQIDLDFLFDYKIFPSSILTFFTQWEREKRKMKIGDTIVQQIFIPPTRIFSQKIVFGVRVNNIIDEADRKGFSYETLEGHVERGESIFTIERSNHGLVFKIKTFSEPGNVVMKLAGLIFTLPYQRYCTNKALENVKKQIEQI